jgi:hypothetical protein
MTLLRMGVQRIAPPRNSVLGLWLAFTLLAAPTLSQEPPSKPDWTPWRFLLGEWIGEGDANDPRQGAGRFTFSFDLQERILVRKNHVEFPPAVNRPASVHDDLLVIFGQAGSATRAHYYDNEGHVILYDATARRDSAATFLSDPAPSAPRFRLSYTAAGRDTLIIAFEIAPPGQSDRFVPYLKGRAHRMVR